ncbi:hypothetical protein [Gluconobacter oxydans]|uniref:Uncharacterized protein n=1 Tax=Gluconobacter oxydans NBRC 3293 TaxID=1315969 RepID=A0A829XC82_GLUOY|nr:hypothetical protein [Gluconobacter oxydans]GEM18006.1 hypothetical protein NBRC3293_2503 [Gluconobacter oxydans NBRC 3293]
MTQPREINEDLSDAIRRQAIGLMLDQIMAENPHAPWAADLRHDDNEIRRECGLLKIENWNA